MSTRRLVVIFLSNNMCVTLRAERTSDKQMLDGCVKNTLRLRFKEISDGITDHTRRGNVPLRLQATK